MKDIVAAQTPVLYLAQLVLGLGIALMLTYFSRVYPRIYLKTWSYSAYTFCVHAISFAYLTSDFGTNPMLRTTAGLLSAVFHNLHILFAFIGIYEAIHEVKIKPTTNRLLIVLTIGAGVVSTAAFAIDPKDFIYQIGTLDLLTAACFTISGSMLLFARKHGIGVNLVAFCFVAYGLTHLYDLSAVIMYIMGQTMLLPEVLGVIRIVVTALVGFGLVIWLLEDEQVELRRSNKELDKFIYSTSHDLKAPVASVLGLINVARINVIDDKTSEFLRLIEDRVKKLDRVITDILSLSKAKKYELKYEIVDFNALFADSVADVKFLADGKNIDIRYLESSSNRFLGDYSLSKMVLGNLLSNAVKYHSPHKPDPYIQVDFEKTIGKVSFTIADNGEGIDEQHHQKIFDMFYRASENSNGTGLGLFIVKETLERIGGSVELESKKGTGTTIKITLNQPG
ncbi:MAG: HAMP domain-containing sensor histidine kinase [Bacteroidota bacterium]